MCGRGSWIEPPPDWCANCFRKFSKHLSPLSLHHPHPFLPPLLWPCVFLPFPWIGKVKSRTIGIRLSISVSAGLCNRKRQVAGWALRQQIVDRQAGRWQQAVGAAGLPRGLGMAAMWLWEPGWSQHWQSEGIDGWTKQGTGCENGWGQRGNLTQTNRMKDREELPAKVCPPLAPTAIYLLLTEHPRIVCIFADFPTSHGRGKLADSSRCVPGFLFQPPPSPPTFTHTHLIQTERLIISKKFTQGFCRINFLPLPLF